MDVFLAVLLLISPQVVAPGAPVSCDLEITESAPLAAPSSAAVGEWFPYPTGDCVDACTADYQGCLDWCVENWNTRECRRGCAGELRVCLLGCGR